MNPRFLLFPERLSGLENTAPLALRVLVGTFLVWGVWDNIVDPARMAEFEEFLAARGFAAPGLMAPLSVWVQFLCGTGIALGLLTRWSGILCAINFTVALVMVDLAGGPRQAFPSAMLVCVGFYLAARGGGCFSLDALLGHFRRTP